MGAPSKGTDAPVQGGVMEVGGGGRKESSTPIIVELNSGREG